MVCPRLPYARCAGPVGPGSGEVVEIRLEGPSCFLQRDTEEWSAIQKSRLFNENLASKGAGYIQKFCNVSVWREHAHTGFL